MIKPADIQKAVRSALIEDKVNADVTSHLLIPKDHFSKAIILAKEDGILCGMDFAKTAFRAINPKITIQTPFKDGAKVKKGQTILTLKGTTRSILAGERTALNFLGYLSGIATTTNKFVIKAKPYKAKILATRKTTPGNRLLEKYAVKVGGGEPHRLNLSDMVLIKDNHRFVYKKFISLNTAIDRFKQQFKNIPVEVEVDTLAELEVALKSNPDMILLDNMSTSEMKKAVAIVKSAKKKTRPLLEASGGITYNNVNAVAKTGVDRISLGALTHHQQWLNFSLDFIN